MKAIVYKNYGPPEVVKLAEIEKPFPKDNEVLVKVHCSTVNRTDCGFRSAEYFIVRFFAGLFRPRQKVLGCEFAGTVESVGKLVTEFKIGDRVFGYNDLQFGAHAEYLVIAEKHAIATIPNDVPFEIAAAITEGAHYALCNLRAAKITSGQRYLINSATGAIGSSALQLAKYFGAEVVATSDTKNMALVKSLGADEVLDYTKEDFTQSNHKFDVVFDAVGKSSFAKCKPLLKENGIYMSTELGYMSQNPFLALITPLLGGKKVLFPIPTTRKEDILFLKDLVASGKFKPVIDRSYTLEQIVDAYRYVESGQKTGNVIVKIV
ncbi:MAG TPA: NAD(P)-dependent alcohol dehydrogenase [Bacteroidia bacterium]|nr:NAD(P)-dependent alcohol dehydrogenase [Bacteroidia bacterium]